MASQTIATPQSNPNPTIELALNLQQIKGSFWANSGMKYLFHHPSRTQNPWHVTNEQRKTYNDLTKTVHQILHKQGPLDLGKTLKQELKEHIGTWEVKAYIEQQEKEELYREKIDQLCQRTESDIPMTLFHREVAMLGMQYLDSFPGATLTPENKSLHESLEDWFNEDLVPHHDILEVLYIELLFRLDQMALANHYVKYLGLPSPDGKRCSEFDVQKFLKWKVVGTDNKRLWDFIKQTLGMDGKQMLFPLPVRTYNGYIVQGFYKGLDYLCAAFYCAFKEKEMSMVIMKAKIQWLVSLMKDYVLCWMRSIKDHPEIKYKGRRYVRAMRSREPDDSCSEISSCFGSFPQGRIEPKENKLVDLNTLISSWYQEG